MDRLYGYTIQGVYRAAGYLPPIASSFTLAWLASHRDRLHTLILGGKRLSVLVVWDSKGGTVVDRTRFDEEAIRQLTYGDPHAQ